MHRDDNPSRAEIARRESCGVVWAKFWPNDDGRVCNYIVFCGGRLLLLLREYEDFLGGQWDLPSGELNAGEGPVEAAVRGLREEAGLRVAEVSEFARYSNPDLGGENSRFHTVTFLVCEADDMQNVQPSGKHPEFKWVTRE